MGERNTANLYRQLVENAGDLIAVLDQDGTIAFINSRVESYQGYTASSTMGRHFSEFVHPDDCDMFQQKADRAFSGEAVTDFEFRILLTTGDIRFFVANGGLTDIDGRQAVMAICRDKTEAVELERKLIARNEALAALSEIAVALSSADDLAQGCSVALDRILSALRLSTGAIILRNPDRKLRIAASRPANLDVLSADAVAAGSLLTQQCIDSGEVTIVPDLYADCIAVHVQQIARALGAEAFVSVPLKCGESTKAALSLAVPKPAELSLEQMEFVNLAAGILGPAIENASLHSDLTDRVSRLAMLERLAKSINAERGVQAVLQACMSEIRQVVPYDMCVIVLFRGQGEADVFPFSEDGSMQSIYGYALNEGQMHSFSGYTGPVVLSDMKHISDYHARSDTFQQSAGSAGMVPLLSMGKPMGLLKVWSRDEHRYAAREMEILQAAAEHLSIAASNATLFEAEQQRTLELDALAKESQHRIKNNLQMVSGMLNVPCRDAKSGSRTLQRCLRQVRAISAVHDMLSMGQTTSTIQLMECVMKIAENALQATGRADEVELVISGGDCAITSDSATAVGVIVNELVMNAVEHGFKGVENGRIDICVKHAGKACSIEVRDNGQGLPDGFVPPEPTAAAGLGLVASLATYGLGGKLEIKRRERGTSARLSLKGV